MGMIEVVIAMFLTTVGVLALLSLQPSGWKAMAKADYLGRASGILYKTLEENEARIMNPCNALTTWGAQPEATVRVSGQNDAISGDVTYTVNTTIVQSGTSLIRPKELNYIVTVTVTWPTNANGISESVTVTRQEMYRFPAGCPNVCPEFGAGCSTS
jgi:Tfp pilus assembly protein PilV